MSKELEMLRVIVGFSGFSPLITRDNLRRILARLEAAERVCDGARELAAARAADRMGGSCESLMAGKSRISCATRALDDALAAYRALDKETK